MTHPTQPTLSRRSFVRNGALWLTGAALVEPVTRKLWAFPVNPCAPSLTEQYIRAVLDRCREQTGERDLYLVMGYAAAEAADKAGLLVPTSQRVTIRGQSHEVVVFRDPWAPPTEMFAAPKPRLAVL